MKVTTQLLGLLARGWAGFTTSGPADSGIEVPPAFLNGGELPQPILRHLGATTADTWNVSHTISGQIQLAVTTSVNLGKLSEGLWEVNWQHYLEVAGAVGDITSTADLTLNVLGITGGPAIMSRVHGTNIEQGRAGRFRISVLKGQEAVIGHGVFQGAGTSTSFSRVFMVCNRLL